MKNIHPDIEQAIASALAASGQTPEFKRRLKKLIENAIADTVPDQDVAEVVALCHIPGMQGDK